MGKPIPYGGMQLSVGAAACPARERMAHSFP